MSVPHEFARLHAHHGSPATPCVAECSFGLRLGKHVTRFTFCRTTACDRTAPDTLATPSITTTNPATIDARRQMRENNVRFPSYNIPRMEAIPVQIVKTQFL